MPKMSTSHPQPPRTTFVVNTRRARRDKGRSDTRAGPGSALAAFLVLVVVAVATTVSVFATSGQTTARASVRPSSTPRADPFTPPVAADPLAPGEPIPTGLDQSDPYLLVASGSYYLYSSGDPGPTPVNVPVSTSADFAAWGPVTDALPTLPEWAQPGFTWAPDVHRFGSTYLLYFTAMLRGWSPSTECIGDAFGRSPAGPFIPLPTPFICQLGLGGSIDPRVFTDASGARFMIWKSEENAGGSTTPTKLWSQPLSPDGLTLTGSPSLLMGPDEPWQGTIVEAPQMVEVKGSYWVLYSGNWFNQPAYGMGVARCFGPSGPCADSSTLPLLGSNFQGLGPGEGSVFEDSSGIWLLYSAWRSLAPRPDFPRPVYIARLGVLPSGPYLAAWQPPPKLGLLATENVWSGTP